MTSRHAKNPSSPPGVPTLAVGDIVELLVLDVLANERRIDGAVLDKATDDVLEALYAWYQDGWVELG